MYDCASVPQVYYRITDSRDYYSTYIRVYNFYYYRYLHALDRQLH